MPSPSETPPVHALFDSRLKNLEQQLAQINAWIRSSFPDSGWVEPELLNAWKYYGGGFAALAYRKQGNVVRLRGLLKGGVSGTAIFTLPEGYRPKITYVLSGVFSTPSVVSAWYVRVESTGNVLAFFSGELSYGSLDGITFTTD